METNELLMLVKTISSAAKGRDRILLAVDLMKSPSIIEKAYYDYKGVYAHFQKNILERINRELEGNFNLRNFEYWPIYDAVSGICNRYLVSTTDQLVKIKSLDMEVLLRPWETIQTGSSQKFNDEMLNDVFLMSGVEVEKSLYDSKRLMNMFLLRSI